MNKSMNKRALAYNTNTPAEVLCTLAKDEDEYVREGAKTNINNKEPNNNRNAHTGVKKTNPNRGCKNKNKSI